MKEALAFAKQHGPIALIAVGLVIYLAWTSEAADSELKNAVASNVNVNGQLLMSVERLVYLQRVTCQNAAQTAEALRACAKDRD